MIGALEPDATLLALKIGFLVFLYIFILYVVRSSTRDLRTAPQESIILSPKEAARLRGGVTIPARRLLVRSSPVLKPGSTVEVGARTPVGRGPENAMRLDGDEYVSGRHALLDPRPDGLWIEDIGSTNGTFVNGARVSSARQLHRGDIVRIGQTDLEVEA